MATEIRTNHVPRFLLELHDLTNKERTELFGDMSTDDIYEQYGSFSGFRFKRNVYNLDDFMRVPANAESLKGWDGYLGESYFSAVLIKLCNDNESVIVGQMFS